MYDSGVPVTRTRAFKFTEEIRILKVAIVDAESR